MRAIDRTFAILELLDDAERPLGLVEIESQLGCPASTTAALLRSLVTHGYLQHDRSTRTYAPTLRLANLAGWVSSRSAPVPPIRRAMAEISERTGETAGLGYRNDIRVQYLHFCGSLASGYGIKPGSTRLLARSGLGWALLTFLSRRALESIVRRTNVAVAAEDMIDAASLESIVDKCRREGHVFAQHTLRVGYGVIASPLPTTRQQYAIGVHGPVDVLTQKEGLIVDTLRDVLKRLVA
ncbi:hypothetical protein BH09PSE5_BH09PSE5_34300 [soil metagenome]